jgi:hypothetical protein
MPAKGEELHTPTGPLGLPGPVGFREFSFPGNDWIWPNWQMRLERLAATERHCPRLSLMVHSYYLRAARPWRQRRLQEKAMDGWPLSWHVGVEPEYEATRLLVKDLLAMGASRDWVKALLDDMHCRNTLFPGDLMRLPPRWLLARYK